MNTIQVAAELIREIDPGLAQAFIAQPFNRQTLITAFHRSLSRTTAYTGLADRIAVALRSATEAA